jgi:hypothetical protein
MPRTTHADADMRPDLSLTSMASVRERTIPTERPPLVSKVSVNSCG